MKLSEVRKLNPIDRLTYWIKERESIRLKKEAGKPKPWTDDEILQSYRFCNPRRMDDKVSKWLYLNWYKPYFNHPCTLPAVALARFINKPESLSLITHLVYTPGRPKWREIKSTLRKYRDAGNVIFNGAYMVRGNDGQDKIECVVDHYVRPMRVEIDRSSMEETWKAIHDCYGFGSFMAGQVVADLRWALDGSWEDRKIWAPIGPGSAKGMNRVQGRLPGQSLGQLQFLDELQVLILVLQRKLPKSISSRMEAHDYQNTLCELSKYEKALWDEGRPKQLYKGI